jgi:hypothetical protein
MSFTTSPVSETVDRGADISFNCTFPHVNVSISWTGPGVNAGGSTCTMSMGIKTSTLMIRNVSKSYAGEYFCTAQFNETMIQPVDSTVGTLSVNCKYYLAMQRLFIIYDISYICIQM